MSKFTKELIIDYADKLLIGLNDEEVNMILNEFDIIEKNMDIITRIPNIEDVVPMTHTLDNFEYVLRNDENVDEEIDIRLLLSNCDEYEGREVKVPKVIN